MFYKTDESICCYNALTKKKNKKRCTIILHQQPSCWWKRLYVLTTAKTGDTLAKVAWEASVVAC